MSDLTSSPVDLKNHRRSGALDGGVGLGNLSVV